MNPFFIIVFAVYLLANSYIFYRTSQALPDILPVKICFYIVFFLVFSAFFVAMLGREHLPPALLKVIYTIGTTWLGVMLYIIIWFLITDIVSLLNHFFHFFPSGFTPLLFHRTQVIIGYLIVCVALSVGYYRFTHPQVVEKEIVIHKEGGKFDQLKAVAMSDLHLGMSINKKRLSRYVDLINAQQPDIIFIAGDLIDNNIVLLEKERMYEELNRLKAPSGIYMCPGNHEYISGIKESSAFVGKTNIKMLVDEVVQVDGSFWVIGRDDKSNPHRLPLTQLIAKANKEQPIILLDHQPYHLEEAEESGVDLQVSGHTHAGQLWPLNYVINAIYEVGYGYKQKGSTHVYVSSGLALWGPEFRIGTQSELVILDIKFRK